MKLEITRLDPSLPMPKYETPGSCAFDVASAADTVVQPGALALIPTGLIVRVPDGHVLILASRSSSPKKGLQPPHGIGVIDRDYCGPNDEMKVLVWNYTASPVTVTRGERIAQGLVMPAVTCDIAEVPRPEGASRGGYGSTG
jgi:dUTP pyrophosphatase